jgi:two-component system sensor histidine kinase KdpD
MTKRLVRILCSGAIAAGITGTCRFLPNIHLATPCVLLLLAVLMIASRWDFWEGAVAAIVGNLLLVFLFMPPRDEWHITSAQYWVVFFTCLIVAIATAHVAARARNLAAEAIRRSQELEQLYAWTRSVSVDRRQETVISQSLHSLVRLFGLEAAVFYDAASDRILGAGPHADEIPVAWLRETVRLGDSSPAAKIDNLLAVPIHVGGCVSGSLGVRGGCISELTFRTIAERMESVLEKSRALEKATQAEAAHRSQELKSAVLDSLIHEVKTPLSVVKTAVSSLLSIEWNPVDGRDLLNIVNEEVDRLDAIVSEVFWTASIQAGNLQPSKDPHDIRNLVNKTISELEPQLSARPFKLEIADPPPQANFDFPMIKGVLKELLKNALKYSPEGSPLTVSVQQLEQEVLISVIDCGIGVSREEQARIFEKHYRGNVKAAGSGLGLAIAKTIVEAHGGKIRVDSEPNAGARFHFSLPTFLQDAV